MNYYAGWLDEITNWLREQIQKFWDAIEGFFTDLVLIAIEKLLDLVATAFEQLPAPAFMAENSIGSLLGSAGPTVGWFVDTFRISECMSVIAAGFIFRISRKILTMGKW